jgi:uncharacterized protein (TIGR03435 family)
MRRVAGVFTAFVAVWAFAQSPNAVSYVASVKPNNAVDARTLSEYSPSGFLNATAITVSTLLRTAYRVQDFQIAGAPGWLATRRYDISARADGTPPPSQQMLVQALLNDRFKLAVHNETRESDVFSLVLAKPDGRLGSQLVKSDFDCDTYLATPRSPTELARNGIRCAYRSNAGSFSGKAIPITQLATVLAYFMGRPVTDKTGLAGRFDMELTWMPDSSRVSAPGDSSGPSLTTAIQEQLGLKLVSEKGPVEMLIVDHVQEPSAN